MTKGTSSLPPSPATHARVNGRAENKRARSLADVFGWSRPFVAELLPVRTLERLETAGALRRCGDLYVSDVRFSTLHGRLYAHSAYPTLAADSVFFGPDTYRFAAFIRLPWLRSRGRALRSSSTSVAAAAPEVWSRHKQSAARVTW